MMRSSSKGANLVELPFIARRGLALSERNFRHVRKVAWFAFSAIARALATDAAKTDTALTH
jgi:hypothetical protein